MVNANFGLQIYAFSRSQKKKLTFFTKFFLFLGISRLFLPSESQKTGLLETKWNVFQQN